VNHRYLTGRAVIAAVDVDLAAPGVAPMSSEAVAAWNVEAKTFHEAPDHGLLDATVRSA
jgi:hypothetical protein